MLVVLAEAPDMDSPVANRFARAPYIGWVMDDGSVRFEPNPLVSGAHGVGPRFVVMLADAGVTNVITAATPGGNAMTALMDVGIRLWDGRGMTVVQALEAYKRGELSEVPLAGRPGRGRYPGRGGY